MKEWCELNRISCFVAVSISQFAGITVAASMITACHWIPRPRCPVDSIVGPVELMSGLRAWVRDFNEFFVYDAAQSNCCSIVGRLLRFLDMFDLFFVTTSYFIGIMQIHGSGSNFVGFI